MAAVAGKQASRLRLKLALEVLDDTPIAGLRGSKRRVCD